MTYNGKSFDLPLIETRFLLHRLETPFAGVPHVDMLHPARRLWRDDAERRTKTDVGRPLTRAPERRRLSAERHSKQTLCGHVREGDVPGFEIPSRYFHFVRTGDARGLAAVMEHNRLDLAVAGDADGPRLAAAGGRAGGGADEQGSAGDGTALRTRRDGRRGARRVRRAAEHREPIRHPRRGLARLAVLSRRERRFEDAATGWRSILELRAVPAGDRPRGVGGARRPPRASASRPAGRALVRAAVAQDAVDAGTSRVARASPRPPQPEDRIWPGGRTAVLSSREGARLASWSSRRDGLLTGVARRMFERRGGPPDGGHHYHYLGGNGRLLLRGRLGSLGALAAFSAFLRCSDVWTPNFLVNRSTRPSVSISF